MKITNRALREFIAKENGFSGIDDVHMLKDVAERFGVARNTLVRWSDLGLIEMSGIVLNGVTYRYCTEAQCIAIESSDVYRKAVSVDKYARAYSEISVNIHTLKPGEAVFSVAEFGEKTGVSEQTLNRWDRSGKFVAKRVVYNNRTYRYYDEEQYSDLMNSSLYENLNQVKNADLIHEHFGKLEVLGFSDSAIRKGYYGSYICKCECGNVVEIPRSELLAGKAKSCGCKFHDLTGHTFSWWHVDGIAPPVVGPDGSKTFRYYCTCVCGQKRIVIAETLRNGKSQSCGCRVEPIGESHIRAYLNSIGLQVQVDDEDGYVQHKTYDDLRGKQKRHLSYDFYVKKDGHEWLIEYQGEQHYRAVDYFGGDVQFEKQKLHDKRKREYAKSIGLKLIEISYKCAVYDDIASVLCEAGIY